MRQIQTSQARLDLKLLLDHLSSGSGDLKLDKYFKVRESHREQISVNFDSLWTLFPPGELVYGKIFQGQDQVFIVQDNVNAWPRPPRPRLGLIERHEPLERTLLCWTYDWDGRTFKRKTLSVDFEKFDDYKPISSLPFYPLHHHQEFDDLKRRLVERGVKYKMLCVAKEGSRMFDYQGPIVVGKKGCSRITGDDYEVSSSGFRAKPVLTQAA